jgi:hypothetical protein
MVLEKQKFIRAVESLDLYSHTPELCALIEHLKQPHIQLPDSLTLSQFIVWHLLRAYPNMMTDKNNKALREFCLSIQEAPTPSPRMQNKK